MDNTTKIIQFARSRYIERDRTIAVLRLNDAYHRVGQPQVVRYYDANGDIDSVFAIGIKEGIGEDCYKIVSLGGVQVVRDVVYDPADVAEVVHGETYIYYNSSQKKGYYIFLNDKDIREFVEITKSQEIYVNVSDRYTWFWLNGELRREDDFYTRAQIDAFFEKYGLENKQAIAELKAIINEIKDLLESSVANLQKQIDDLKEDYDSKLEELDSDLYGLSIKLNSDNRNLYLIGTTAEFNTALSVYRKGKSITSQCSFKINGETVSGANNKLSTVNDMHYTFEASYQVLPKKTLKVSTELDIKFGYLFYFGVVNEDWVADSETVKALGNNKIQGKEVKETECTFDLELGTRAVFACPKVYGTLKSIKDGNCFDMLGNELYTVTEITIDKRPYLVYKTKEDVKINKLIQIYGY